VGNTTALTSATSSGAVAMVQTRSYNALNRVVTDTVSGPGTLAHTTLTAYDYDGNMVQLQHPNGDVTYTTYGLGERRETVEVDPAAVSNPGSSPATAVFASYAYDEAGNVTSSEDVGQRIRYLTLT
jgi:hypothetical protein